MVPFQSTKTMHFNFDNCYRFKLVDGSVYKIEVFTLFCEKYEEADEKIVYYVCKITDDAEIVITCSDTDTDILVIFLGNMSHLLSSSLKVWIDIATGNNQRYISVTSLHHEIGELLSKGYSTISRYN